ncbi:DEAD/DEAH box helicase [Candidatus Woesearchaeota archaeon]|nr:DEAD/DEAH box helicase [Candidatus Woesearchaeota archaeon]
MRFKEFVLDPFQVEAISSVDKNNSVIVSAPTGSGKTLIADYIIDRELKGNNRVIYTAPIKALSNQKYRDFVDEYGEDRIGLVTGDLVINPSAQVLIMTTEVYRNMAVIKDPMLSLVSYCIMDEIHYINDEERGYVWEESIIFSPDKIRFLFLSATVPNADEFASWVSKIKKQAVDVVRYDFRPVPLDIKFFDRELGITTLEKIKEKKELDSYPRYRNPYDKRVRKEHLQPPEFTDLVHELDLKDHLPCIYFVFSRARTQEYAQRLAKKDNFLFPEEKARVAEVVQEGLKKVSRDVLSLKSVYQLRECLSKGIGFHHAGLLPDIKHIVESLFSEGIIKVLFATETFAVGINMPARTVCFDSLRKYTGSGFRYLTTKEFYQISGRAGRRGMDSSGLSVSVIHRPAFEFSRVKELTSGDTMPIMSQFRLSYNTVLNMVNLHTPEEIKEILSMNFYTFQEMGQNQNMLRSIKARYDKMIRTLVKMGYVVDNNLTGLGAFASKIYADELEISQIFMHLKIKLDEYKILLLLAALCYEPKKEVRFYKSYSPKVVSDLKYALRNHDYLKRCRWMANIDKVSSIVYPMYQHKKFVEILKNTNMPEGDLMRILMQVLDRLEQVDRALLDHDMIPIVRNCKYLIRNSLEGIGVF